MERREEKGYGAHVLALPYPSQGHISPMIQFCKRLVSKGLKATLVITNFISNSIHPNSDSVIGIGIDTISDGYDQGGFAQAESIQAYLDTLRDAGSTTLAELIDKYKNTAHPIDCVIYDAFLPWALDITKRHGLVGAAFFTQPCSVNYVYYHVYHGLLTVPISSLPVSIPGLPLLQLEDLPSFIYVHGSYPAYFELVLNQFLDVEKADYIFVNTFYKLEDEVVDTMSKISPLVTIGPTIPSFYLDNRLEYDRDYGLNLFDLDSSSCTNWLSAKPEGSVIYVSFGSMANLAQEQMEELAWGLKENNNYFLWVIRTSKEEKKLPKEFIEESGEKGLLVRWSPQLEVLSSKAVGCFFSHCGWNSTIEALSLGVPMVVMPQWTDQTMNAKLVQDVWKVGIRVKVDEKGLVERDEIKSCLSEIMEKEGGKEMKLNAIKWRDLAKEAVSEGGTSDKNMDEFVFKLTN